MSDGDRRSIFDDFQNFDFCKKIESWVFSGLIGHSGILEISVFGIFSRFCFFVFLGFFGVVWKFRREASALVL